MRRSLESRLRLIVITDLELALPRALTDVVGAVVEAGAPAIQLRAKKASARDLFGLGLTLLPRVRAAGALLFVNDRVDVALALGADGVHVGPDDVPVAGVRSVIERTRGREGQSRPFFVGASSDDPETARRLSADGADYIGCGTVYPTTTKPNAGSVIGLDGLQRVVDAVQIPVVGIGGIDPARAGEVAADTGAAGVAVIGAVMTAADPRAVVEALMEPWRTRD